MLIPPLGPHVCHLRAVGRAYLPTCDVASRGSFTNEQGGNERVNPTKEANRALQEEARRLKEGAHRYRRREALARRDRRREREVLLEQLKKDQSSD
jgi:hypothetical protein